jgi:V-type H+-transporting ATPase subunit A
VTGGDIYGTVFENRMVKHKMMLPPRARGTVTWVASPGHYRVTDKILQIEFDGEKTDYTMLQVSSDFDVES